MKMAENNKNMYETVLCNDINLWLLLDVQLFGDKYKSILNMFHIRALNEYFYLYNKTNTSTYVKCVYHTLFITNMFRSLKQTVKIHKWNTHCYKAPLKLST